MKIVNGFNSVTNLFLKCIQAPRRIVLLQGLSMEDVTVTVGLQI